MRQTPWRLERGYDPDERADELRQRFAAVTGKIWRDGGRSALWKIAAISTLVGLAAGAAIALGVGDVSFSDVF